MASKVPLAGIRSQILGSTPITHISVTNFAASICEIKSLYQKMKVQGRDLSPASQKSLEFGNATHQRLDDMKQWELPIPEAATLSPHLPAALKLLDTARRWKKFATEGSGREIPLYGEYKGIKLYGIADGFEKYNGNLSVVENKTTLGRLPPQEYKIRLAYHQALMYRYMFTQMMSPRFKVLEYATVRDVLPSEQLICPGADDAEFVKNQPCVVDKSLSIEIPYTELTLARIYDVVESAFEQLRSAVTINQWMLDNRITLRYTTRNSATEAYELEYDPETEHQLLEYCSELWLGKREPSPFRSDGNLTCNWCQFADICEFVGRAKKMGVRVK